jgi:hypothetical protein
VMAGGRIAADISGSDATAGALASAASAAPDTGSGVADDR